MGQWKGSPCGSRDEAAWQGVEGTRDTDAHLPQLSMASWYPQGTSPLPTQWQGCCDRGAAGMGFWAVCQGQHSALTLLGLVCQHESLVLAVLTCCIALEEPPHQPPWKPGHYSWCLVGHWGVGNQPCSQHLSCLLFLVLIGVGVETLQRGQFKSLAFYLL